MAQKTAAEFVAGAKALIGSKYWYGCSGEEPTAALLESKIRQFPGIWTPARIEKARGEIGKCRHVLDCVGLVRKAAGKERDRDALYTNAEGLRQKSNPQPIATLPENPGVCLFIRSRNGKPGHVGVYIGNGRVVESYNFRQCADRPISAQKWEQWGRIPWVDYGQEKPVRGIQIGDRVRIKEYGVPYYPGGVKIPDAAWLRGMVMTVNGLSEMDGVPCARLAEITSWCACANLEKVEG
ncbi:MAG: C40 family peptidase [Firmicutes bacterium]|nr:C40 family peptidase [Bacillota bacterium]